MLLHALHRVAYHGCLGGVDAGSDRAFYAAVQLGHIASASMGGLLCKLRVCSCSSPHDYHQENNSKTSDAKQTTTCQPESR